MPDGLNPVDYRFTEKLDARGWAWEFLRRNETYAAEFKRELEAFRELRSQGRFGWLPEDINDPEFHIPFFRDPRSLVKRWGVVGFWNPDQDEPQGIVFFPPGYQAELLYYGHEAEAVAANPSLINEPGKRTLLFEGGQVAVLFDLSKHLPPQLDRARSALEGEQQWFL